MAAAVQAACAANAPRRTVAAVAAVVASTVMRPVEAAVTPPSRGPVQAARGVETTEESELVQRLRQSCGIGVGPSASAGGQGTPQMPRST